ncbi:hypothetical protein [Pseudomonas cannabina]|nr:hypothetical protein [Pseudomonas cannabina]
MWVLTHDLGTVRTLSDRERELLEGFVASNLAGQEVAHANSLLRRIRSDGQWIGCECCLPMPVLNVALMDSGRLVMRNNPEGNQHKPGCPFSHDLIKNKPASKPKDHLVTRVNDDSHIALHSEFQSSGKGSVPKISRTDAAVTQVPPRKLLSLSMSILERAGLNVFSPASKPSVAHQYEAIRKSVRSLTLSPGVPLDNFFETKLSKQRLVAMSVKLRASKAFGASRRVGLLMDTIQGVKGRSLQLFGSDELTFFGHIERSAPPSFPALALATVTGQAASTGFFEIGNVATIPVLSKTCLFPVFDEADRTAVQSIFGLLDWFYTTKKIEITAVRHIFSLDGGALLELRSPKLILYVCFQDANMGEGAPPANMIEVVRLSTFENLSGLKKALTKRFLGAHSA